MKKVGDTMLKEWLEKAGADGQAVVDAYQQDVGAEVPVASLARRGPLGRALDRLYDASAALGALAMVLLLAMVMLSIVSPPGRLQRPRHRRLRRLHDGRRRLPGAGAHAEAAASTSASRCWSRRCTARARRGIEVWSLFARPRCWRCSRPATAASWPGSRTPSTTSRPATTPRRCGCRSSRWRSARSCWRSPSSTSWCSSCAAGRVVAGRAHARRRRNE